MAQLQWDQTGERYYETGVDHGALYPYDSTSKGYINGVAWNGLVTVTESPSGAEANPVYADNIKYLNLLSAEEFGGTIEAFTYPDEFAECDGSYVSNGVSVGQQARKTFGLSYRTRLGNDENADAYGYKLHLVWGALASPSEKAYTTVNDTPEAITFSWEFSTTPLAFKVDGNFSNLRPTAVMTITSTTVDATKLKALEDVLYGVGQSGVPTLPSPDEVMEMLGVESATTGTTPPAGDTGGE